MDKVSLKSCTGQDQLVVDCVEEELRGLIKPGIKLPRERDLAEQFGVSRQSVRQAMLRLKRERLVKSIQGKGTYAISPTQQKSVVHLVSRSVQDSYSLMCIGVLTEVLREQGHLVHLVGSHNPAEDWDEIISDHKRTAGAILIGNYSRKELESITRRCDVPLVHVSDVDECYRRRPLCDGVINDNAAMGFCATEYLIQQGHQRIAIMWWGQGRIWDREMHRGYNEALRTYGIEPNPDWMICLPSVEYSPAGDVANNESVEDARIRVRAQIDRWRQSNCPPTALLHSAGAELPLRECVENNFGDMFDPQAVLAVIYWELLLGNYLGESDATAVCLKFRDIAERAIDLLLHRKKNNAQPTREIQGRIFITHRRNGRWQEM